MSSKVVGSDAPAVGQMAWRHVGHGARPGGDTAGAEALLAQFQAEAERRVREAHAAGFREGQDAGRGEAAARVEAAV
jgi:hypothetical protein